LDQTVRNFQDRKRNEKNLFLFDPKDNRIKQFFGDDPKISKSLAVLTRVRTYVTEKNSKQTENVKIEKILRSEKGREESRKS